MGKFDDLEEALALTGIPNAIPAGQEIVKIDELELTEIESNLDLVSEDFKADYALVRQSYHYQQEMLLDAAKIALQNAKDNDGARLMEVFSTLMNSWASSNKELLKMHREIKEIQAKSVPATTEQPATINNTQTNIMVGTPADLIDTFGSQFDQRLKAEAGVIEHED